MKPKIIAIVIARPMMNPDQNDPYVFDYEGNCLYLDCLWCPNKLKLAAIALVKRFGSKREVCWHRWRGSPRLHKAKAEKLLTKLPDALTKAAIQS